MNERMEQEIERTLQVLQAYMPTARRKGGRLRRAALRRGVAILLAAAAALCMSGFAYALFVSDWLSQYFAGRADDALTPGQYQFIEEMRVGIGQSVTVDGYTVTIDSALCDAQNLFLVVRVEAPEGVKIDFEPSEASCDFSSVHCTSTGAYPRTGSLMSYLRSWTHLDDGDGKENTVTLLMKDQRVLSEDSNEVYTDGEIWNVELSGLVLYSGEYFEKRTPLAEGGWRFAFPLSEVSGEVEMIAEPVACIVPSGGENGPKFPTEIQITSFLLRPFGAVCRYTCESDGQPRLVDFPETRLLMKDGSIVFAKPSMGGGVSPLGPNSGYLAYAFDTPILLDEVAYLLLGEDVQIPFPEQ